MIPENFKSLELAEKGKIVKKLLEEEFHIRQYEKILSILSRITCYKSNKIKKLTPQELLVFEFLLKNNLNSRICYDWILLAGLPSEISSRIKNNELSTREALKEYTKWKREQYDLTFSSLINDVKRAVRGL